MYAQVKNGTIQLKKVSELLTVEKRPKKTSNQKNQLKRKKKPPFTGVVGMMEIKIMAMTEIDQGFG